jgi:hypothetical protein
MKKILIASLFIFAVTAYSANATGLKSKKKNNKEFKDAPRTIFTSYPFAFFGSSLKAGFEFYIPDNKSLNIVPSYTGSEYSNIYNVYNLSTFMMEVQFRFFLNKLGNNAPLNGFYVSPFILYSTSSFSDYLHTTQEILHASTFGAGYYIGYQHVFPGGLTLGFYGGGGAFSPSGDYDRLDASVNPYSKGVKPRGSVTVGFAF